MRAYREARPYGRSEETARNLALKGLEVERHRLDEEIAEILRQLDNRAARHASPQSQSAKPRKGGGLAAAGWKALSNAMKRRLAGATDSPGDRNKSRSVVRGIGAAALFW